LRWIIKEYKEELAQAQDESEILMKLVGKVTVEKEWLEKKLKSLASSDKKQMIEPKLTTLSLKGQCALLGLNRSSFYYKKAPELRKHK